MCSVWRDGRARAARYGAAALLACGGGEDGGRAEAPAALVGGWSNEANHLYACVAEDGRLWLGDSLSEIAGASHCELDDAGGFSCSFPDAEEGASDFRGTLQLAADRLTVTIADCPAEPEECESEYQSDPNVACE